MWQGVLKNYEQSYYIYGIYCYFKTHLIKNNIYEIRNFAKKIKDDDNQNKIDIITMNFTNRKLAI